MWKSGAGHFGGTQTLAAIAPEASALATALVARHLGDLDARAAVQARRSAANVVRATLV